MKTKLAMVLMLGMCALSGCGKKQPDVQQKAQPSQAPQDAYTPERNYIRSHPCTLVDTIPPRNTWSVVTNAVEHHEATQVYECKGVDNHFFVEGANP